MVVSIGGKHHWLWRAVDSEGEVLDLLVQPRRDKKAAVRLIRKLLKKQGFVPTVLVTDELRSYGAVRRDLGRVPKASCRSGLDVSARAAPAAKVTRSYRVG